MTGMRRGEIANLQWQQIDIEKGYFYLNNTVHLTKNRRIRNIPLTDGVIAIVKNRFIKRTCDYVFTYKKEKWNISTLKRYFVLLTKKTFGKDAGVTFHTLRHSFASNLVAGGISIYEVSKLLGHADIKTTQIYAHLREDTLKEVIKGIDIKREKLFSNN
jgi:integrase